ncbi:MAG: hypothetical protein K1Y36_14265 [Blastocatellia bacterium]|nr:hypothetical protein [Blastocatellia bacterium]
MASDLQDGNSRRRSLVRSFFLLSILVLTGLGSGCVTSRVNLPVELPVQKPLTSADLVTRINSLQEITQIKSSVSLQFADYKESGLGKGKVYPTAEGKLVLQRPQNIRLIVDATLIGRIADMGSDGERFAVAVFYPTDKRSFIRGSNNRQYASETEKLVNDPSAKDVSTFSKLRPQHLALPLLVPPIPVNHAEYSSFVIESRQDEADLVRKSDGSLSMEVPAKRVMRTYYVLYVTHRLPDGRMVPSHCYWFDRTRPGTPFVRLQLFEENGTLNTEAEYDGFSGPNGQPQPMPRSVKISRPHDGYALRVVYRQAEVNSEQMTADVFTVQNDENLHVLDLDAQANQVRAKASEN